MTFLIFPWHLRIPNQNMDQLTYYVKIGHPEIWEWLENECVTGYKFLDVVAPFHDDAGKLKYDITILNYIAAIRFSDLEYGVIFKLKFGDTYIQYDPIGEPKSK